MLAVLPMRASFPGYGLPIEAAARGRGKLVSASNGNGHLANLDTALDLLNRGLWSHAIHDKGDQREDGTYKSGKNPIGEGWGLARWNEDRLRNAFQYKPRAGVGIALGPGRGPDGEWLGDLEGDGPEAADSLELLLGCESLETMGWGSTRGSHNLFTVDGKRLLKLLVEAGAGERKGFMAGVWHLDELPGLEFRIGGYKDDGKTVKQVQSVCPPTVGDDGKHREWNGVETISALPEHAYTLLAELAEQRRKDHEGILEGEEGSIADDPLEMTVPPSSPFKLKAPVTANTHAERVRSYGLKALKDELDEFSRQPAGERHAFLLGASLRLAGLVKAGALAAPECLAGLKESARSNGMGEGRFDEIDEAWRSAYDMATARDLSVIKDDDDEQKSNSGTATGSTDDPEEWGDILDRWPTIRPEAFHGVAGEIVKLCDPETEADPVAVLLQVLTGFGNLAGRRPYFVVGGTQHYLNMFVALVGQTAVGRKGTSWDVARHPLGLADPEWVDNRVHGGLVSGEGLIFHVRDATVVQKNAKDPETKQVSKVTVETDAGVADKRLLIIETEMGRVLKAMNRDSSTLSDVIRQCWDSGNLRTLNRKDPIKATGAHVSIVAHVTPADIRKHLSETDSANGFSNRFLWVCSRRSKLLPEGGDVFSIDWRGVKKKLDAAVSFARGASIDEDWSQNYGGGGRRMKRDKAAREAWNAIYENLSAGKPGLLGMILSRAEAQVMRLACLYALLDCSPEVGIEHLGAALALWDYCVASARLVFGDDMGDRDAEKLLAALGDAPGGLTKTQITVEVFGRHKKKDALTMLLSDLLTQGLIHRVTQSSDGGRPAERWFLGRKVDAN
jgi:hypothetical protein